MIKVIIGLIFLFSVASCKIFKGFVQVQKGQTLIFKAEKEDPFYEDEDEGGYEDKEVILKLKPGSYQSKIVFSSENNFSISVTVDDEEYTASAYSEQNFSKIKQDGLHNIFISSKDLNQNWSLKAKINTKVYRGDLMQGIEFCSALVEVWKCRRNSKGKQICQWKSHYESGQKDVDYYNRTTDYDIFATIISGSKDLKNNKNLGSYTSQTQENIRVYQYSSCCYDYYNSCIERRRHGRRRHRRNNHRKIHKH